MRAWLKPQPVYHYNLDELDSYDVLWVGAFRSEGSKEEVYKWFSDNLSGYYELDHRFNGGEPQYFFNITSEKDFLFLVMTFGMPEVYIDNELEVFAWTWEVKDAK